MIWAYEFKNGPIQLMLRQKNQLLPHFAREIDLTKPRGTDWRQIFAKSPCKPLLRVLCIDVGGFFYPRLATPSKWLHIICLL